MPTSGSVSSDAGPGPRICGRARRLWGQSRSCDGLASETHKLPASTLPPCRAAGSGLDTAVHDYCDRYAEATATICLFQGLILTPHNFAPDGPQRPAQTVVGKAVSRRLLARRKPGVQIPSPPPPASQVRASPASSRRRSPHSGAAPGPRTPMEGSSTSAGERLPELVDRQSNPSLDRVQRPVLLAAHRPC